MAKPSIYSRDYDKKMRNRRRRLISTIIVILFIGVLVVIGSRNLKDDNGKIFGFLNKQKNTEENLDNPTDRNSTEEEVQKEQDKEPEQVEEIIQKESLEIILSSGDKVTAFIDLNEGVKTFDKLDIEDSLYSINPSKNLIILLEKSTQSLLLYDIDGDFQNLTKESHISTKGVSYSKENRIEKYPDFVWCSLPKFINDDEFVYVSQLPLLNIQENKYLWTYSISNHAHNLNGAYFGKYIEYGNLTEEGLEVIIDGNNKLIK